MNLNSLVFYIKNGKENTYKINCFNYNYILKKFSNDVSLNGSQSRYEVFSDVEFLKFQNVKFNNDLKFMTSPNTTVIFDNCVFKGNFFLGIGGNFVFENPNFDEKYVRVFLNISCAKSLRIDTHNYDLSNLSIYFNGDNLVLNNIDKLNSIDVSDSFIVDMNSVFNISKLDVKSLVFQNSNGVLELGANRICSSKVKLENGIINSNDVLNIDCSTIEAKNFYLIAKKAILLSGKSYKWDNDDSIILDASSTSLISQDDIQMKENFNIKRLIKNK